ncbi:MAG: phage portal protein [Patulibacter minatonensis]
MAEPITDLAALSKEVNAAAEEIGKRVKTGDVLESYFEGKHPIPEAVRAEKKTKAYMRLMEMSRTNFPKLCVEAILERCVLTEVVFADGDLTKLVGEAWHDNGMDAEWPLALQSALTVGSSYVIVWADEDERPIIDVDHSSTTIVRYARGSRRRREAAFRVWSEGDAWFATVYHPHFTYRLQGAGSSASTPTAWEPREDDGGEDWTIPNPLGEVNVIEIAANRRLTKTANRYGHSAGQYADALGHVDRINYAVFSMLVAMTWSGFPLRGKIGDPILKDDDGNDLAPFDVAADTLVQVENPEGKLVQLPEATLTNFIEVIETSVKHFAAVVGTPAYYLLAEFVNVGQDTIRASDARLVSICRRHKRPWGEAATDIGRLVAKIVEPDAERDASAHATWGDDESRTMAERADAALKLKDIIPWQAIVAKVLNATPAEIAVWEGQRASELFNVAQAADLKAKTDALGVIGAAA